VEFLGIEDRIDLISFVRMISFVVEKEETEADGREEDGRQQKVIEITILEGCGFSQLYNGIKPNAMVRVPELGIQTQVSHRNCNPSFNEEFEACLDNDKYHYRYFSMYILSSLKVEVYHCSADDEDSESILIGEGSTRIDVGQLLGSDKIIKV
jgi:hypothetical protein